MNSPSSLDAGALATIASIIIAFAVPMLFFRIQRELQMETEGERNWIPWADRLLIAAALVSIVFVILPLIVLAPTSVVRIVLPPAACGASAILVAGYIPAILAHYRLFLRGKRRGQYDNPEPGERLVVIVTTILVALEVCWTVGLGGGALSSLPFNPTTLTVEQGTLIASILTMITTAAALYFAVSSFKKQMRLNFFADYTKRYQEIILGFPESINERNFSLDRLPKDTKDKTLRHMRAYFDLCSEEYFLWRHGNLGDNVWREWEIGIRFALSKPAFRQAWKKLREDTIYQGDFALFVESAVDDEGV